MITLQNIGQNGNNIQKQVDALHLLTDNGTNKDFKIISQLASEAAALENEALSTKIVLLSQKVNMLYKFNRCKPILTFV